MLLSVEQASRCTCNEYCSLKWPSAVLGKFYFSLLSHYINFFSVIRAAVISCCATRLQYLSFFFIISYNLETVVVFSLFTEYFFTIMTVHLFWAPPSESCNAWRNHVETQGGVVYDEFLVNEKKGSELKMNTNERVTLREKIIAWPSSFRTRVISHVKRDT